jgi:hypothetical protein
VGPTHVRPLANHLRLHAWTGRLQVAALVPASWRWADAELLCLIGPTQPGLAVQIVPAIHPKLMLLVCSRSHAPSFETRCTIVHYNSTECFALEEKNGEEA